MEPLRGSFICYYSFNLFYGYGTSNAVLYFLIIFIILLIWNR